MFNDFTVSFAAPLRCHSRRFQRRSCRAFCPIKPAKLFQPAECKHSPVSRFLLSLLSPYLRQPNQSLSSTTPFDMDAFSDNNIKFHSRFAYSCPKRKKGTQPSSHVPIFVLYFCPILVSYTYVPFAVNRHILHHAAP